MISQDFLLSVAKEKELSTSAKTLLFFLMGSANADNYIFFRQKDIAEELEIDSSDICRCLKNLVKKGIIVKAGAASAYKLNPDYGLKNSAIEPKKKHMIAIHVN